MLWSKIMKKFGITKFFTVFFFDEGEFLFGICCTFI